MGVDGIEAGAALAGAAIGCGAVFSGFSSGCSPDEAGLDSNAEAGGCIAGDKDGFADCCAFALSVRSKEAEITQCQMRIANLISYFERSGAVAVVLVVVTHRLLAWGVLSSATGGCWCSLI
jgi:hypothetical protein